MRRYWPAWLLAVLLVPIFSSGRIHAQTTCVAAPVAIIGTPRLVRLPAGTPMTPQRFRELPETAFEPVRAGLFLGATSADWWVDITLHNPASESCVRWLQVGPVHLPDAQVFVPRADGGWTSLVAGTAYPHERWPTKGRQPIFPLDLAPGTTHLVARVATRGVITSFAPKLWDPVRFQGRDNARALGDGLVYGVIALMVLVSLVATALFRSRSLCLIALATGAYLVFDAIQKNYLFTYLWPDAVAFNQWALYFAVGVHFAALFAYVYQLMRVRRLGYWRWALYLPLALFGAIALFGGLPGNTSVASVMVVAQYQILLWLLALLYATRWLLGKDRRWFPALFLAAFCFRSVTTFAPLLGIDIRWWSGNRASAPMVAILAGFLLVSLFEQMYVQRRRQRAAKASLAAQRASENQRLAVLVAERTGELERALTSRRHLLARISHDLRSPLSGMLDSARLWKSGDQRRDHPALIERHARQQMDLIDELLEFSRAELTDLELDLAPGYLHAFLDDVVDQATWLCERKRNRLKCDISDTLPAVVVADFRRLRQVLSNLLGNAAKFTHAGHVRFSVHQRGVTDDSQIRMQFVVADDGVGMSPDERDELVRPFVRGRGMVGREGSGLGLAIVVRLLDLMGARLCINSTPGMGSRVHFTLTLPLASESAMDPLLEPADEEVNVEGAQRTVVVVDDDLQQRELLCDLLDSCGFRSMPAADGAQALDWMRAHAVALVVTDQNMPGMDGWTLLRELRLMDRRLPVVLYSALPPRPPSDWDATMRFSAVLLKPGNVASVLRTVARVLALPDPMPSGGQPASRVF